MRFWRWRTIRKTIDAELYLRYTIFNSFVFLWRFHLINLSFVYPLRSLLCSIFDSNFSSSNFEEWESHAEQDKIKDSRFTDRSSSDVSSTAATTNNNVKGIAFLNLFFFAIYPSSFFEFHFLQFQLSISGNARIVVDVTNSELQIIEALLSMLNVMINVMKMKLL